MDINTVQNVQIETNPAGFAFRALSMMLDYTILLFLFWGLILIPVAFGINSNQTYLVILLFVFSFYSLILELMFNGQTIGKMIFKLRVVKTDNSRVSFLNYLLRWVFRVIDIFLTIGGCAVVCIALTDRSQRLGDVLASTTVIRIPQEGMLEDTAFIQIPDNYVTVYPSINLLSESDIEIVLEVIQRHKKGNFKDADKALIHKTRIAIEKKLNTRSDDSDLRVLYDVLKDYNYYNR